MVTIANSLGMRFAGLRKSAYVRQPPARPPEGRLAKVSIIIPCYNYAHFLRDSVNSVLAQTAVSVEIIIVDDASTDNTFEVAERLRKGNPDKIHVIRHRQNTKHVVAFNDGYAIATGEFIVRLDADDLLTQGSLARSVALFDAFPSVGLVYGHPRHFGTTVPPNPRVGAPRSWSIWSGPAWVAERCRRGYNVITTPEVVLRADVMKRVGPLSLRLRYAQDMEMWLRVASVSDVGRVDGPDQALHRDHSASMSSNAGAGHMTDIIERREVFATLFDGPGKLLPNAKILHESARRALAAEALEAACRAFDRGRTRVADVDGYIQFALSTYSGAENLAEWRAFARRREIGAAAAPYMPHFLPRILWRGIKHRFNYRRWCMTGI